jgi:hypothetical protein
VRTVLRAHDPGEAYRARDLLRESGIAAEVSFETRAQGGLVPLDLRPVAEVWIADEARAEEARALLAAMEGGGRGGPPWTCTCGAENEGAFDACPTCGAERRG